MWRALTFRSSLPLAFLGPHRLFSVAVDRLFCQLSQTDLTAAGWVSGRLCGKELRSEGFTFAPVSLDLKISKPGA